MQLHSNMSDLKTTISCPDCNKKYNFPILAKQITFKCRNTKCNKEFTTPINRSSFKNIKLWKISTITLLLISFLLIALLYQNGKEKRIKDKLAKDFTNSLKNHTDKGVKGSEFVEAKSHLTKNTAELFSLFIESQYEYQDSISIVMVEGFLNTLIPLNYGDSRKFMYKNIKGDTIYFYSDYELVDGEYKLKVDINEFMK